MDFKGKDVTATVEEIAIQNMMLTEAIFELLAEKGLLSGAEVLDRIKKLKAESKITLRRPN